jgi:hypothetical protein
MELAKEAQKMKKKTLIILIIGMILSMSFMTSYAHARGGHHYRGGGAGYAAGALVGGLLLGTVIGSAISQPRYVAPAPVYAYPAPVSAYAYPSAPAYVSENPPGEWVVVPGRWVNGAWVPSHRVWSPVNPY